MPLAFWANADMYERLESLCISKDVRLTIFVDDLTFSGAQVDLKFSKDVGLIIKNAGLTVHPDKTKLYSREQPKLITGVIVDKVGISVRNEHHKLIYQLFSDMKECKNDDELKAYQKQLIGRLSAAGQINQKFKQRAKTYMRANK